MVTVLYDGGCALCRASADRLRHADSRRALELLDLRQAAASGRFPQIEWERARALMQAVDDTGRVYSGVDAWTRAARELPRWRWLAAALPLPGVHWVAARVYAWIARNRYRWNRQRCADGDCRIHAR